MSYYLVEAYDGDDGRGVKDLPVIGPFTDDATALAFAIKYKMGRQCESFGGYSGVTLVSDDDAQSPEDFANSYNEDFEEGEEEYGVPDPQMRDDLLAAYAKV